MISAVTVNFFVTDGNYAARIATKTTLGNVKERLLGHKWTKKMASVAELRRLAGRKLDDQE